MLDVDFYREELILMRENYKNKPLDDIWLHRPAWLGLNDPMSNIYSRKARLLQQGEIVYATIVQANSNLFRNFPPFDYPAHIVYSTEPHFSEHPDVLYDISWGLYNYKGQPLDTVPDEWKSAVRVVTDEYDRSGFTLSLNLQNQSLEYNMIPTMIYRKLLPKRKLCGTIIPVLAMPEFMQALILPKEYWTPRFTDAWIEGSI